MFSRLVTSVIFLMPSASRRCSGRAFDGRLLEELDGDVVEQAEAAVEVVADHADHAGAEALALFVQLHELHLLAGGLEGLGEFGAEQSSSLTGSDVLAQPTSWATFTPSSVGLTRT